MYEIGVDELVVGFLKELYINPKKEVVILHNGQLPATIPSSLELVNEIRRQQGRIQINYRLVEGNSEDEYMDKRDRYYIVNINKIELKVPDDYLERILNYENTTSSST